GRPVAGKTGTTSSNKDGWFLGFSSGITTGVWMGRDDARAVGVLQGGRAPARAFAAYMKVATAKRPVEQFETEVTLPEWQLEPDEEAYYGAPDNGADPGMMVDENGLPIERGRPEGSDPEDDQQLEVDPEDRPQPPKLDQQWIDNVLGRQRQQQPRPAPNP
ncbi:MAG: penicillin-binding protein, partial [Sphingobium sp.]